MLAGALILAVSILLFNSEIVATVFGLALGGLNVLKLSSASLTVAAALILALLGARLAGPFGIVVGGITAFSLQEFVTQRRRDEVKRGNILDASGSRDLEFPYDEIEQVQLLRNGIRIHLKDRVVRIAISRRSARILGPMLEKIIPAKILSGPVPSGRDP